MKKWRSPVVLSIVGTIVLLVVAVSVYYSGVARHTITSQTSRSGYVWRVKSGASAQDLQQMDHAVGSVMVKHPVSIPSDQQLSFESVVMSGDWAVTEGVTRNTKTGALIEGEGFVILLHRTSETWHAAYPGTADFQAWLDEIPDALIAPGTKQLLR
jgi:hypothetical protein